MNRLIVAALLLICLSTIAKAQGNLTSVAVNAARILPANFKTDGCTFFPDGGYRDCCVRHDLTYFAGGSLRERLRADNRLFLCVAKKKGWQHKIIAPLMWAGVRIGGVGFLPTPFRWGFGRRPKKLTTSDKFIPTRNPRSGLFVRAEPTKSSCLHSPSL